MKPPKKRQTVNAASIKTPSKRSPKVVSKVALNKFLTFELARETYGIDVLKIREIIGVMGIRQVPNAPEFVKGVINLRGKIIPVVDLRLRFGLEASAFTDRTCIVVVDLDRDGTNTLVGVVVDTVSEVSQISAGDIEPPPALGGKTSGHIQGMAKHKNKVVILLDIDKVLGAGFKGIG